MTSDAVYDAMLLEWRAATAEPDPVPAWETAFEEAAAAQLALRASGQWRAGGKTLLHALGLHHSEVHLCAGLAWLLTPDGWHGLGSSFLAAFLTGLGVEVDPGDLDRAVVVTEESRGDTRADVVVRLPSRMVLVEAKVWAREQPTQCDRLANLWASEDPVLVFLTRDGVVPFTAVESRDRWQRLTWYRVAQLLTGAVTAHRDAAAGVLDYLQTLQTYGGTPRG